MDSSLKLKKEITAPLFFLCSSFVAAGCKGNPAGVCLLPAPRDEKFYKAIAAKINFSETAFLYPQDGVFQLRWFTPTGHEVSLCGHATLAASWILVSQAYVASGANIHFNTKSGILSAAVKNGVVIMDFPLRKVVPVADEYNLAGLLGLKILYLGKSGNNLLAEVPAEKDVKELQPDMSALKKIPVHGFIITAVSADKEYDFVSRFFAPSIGIPEDPVTGSAHCSLADYWNGKLHKTVMVGHQVSREGGRVGVSINKDRVALSGRVEIVPVSDTLEKELGVIVDERG